MIGPGTALSQLIPDWATNSKKGCNCKSYAAKMDKYGADWCERNLDTIVAHLLGQTEYLTPAIKIMPVSGRKLAASMLVKYAIKKSRGS